MEATLVTYGLSAAALMLLLNKLRTRLLLSRAKHPSLRGHSRIARWVAKRVPFYEYDEATFFESDAAPPEIAEQRRIGLLRLSALFRQRFVKSVRATEE